MNHVRSLKLLGALFLTACSGAGDPEGTQAGSAADTTTSLPPVAAKECLVPTGTGPGVHELWLLEGMKLERTTAFFWRHFIGEIGGSPPVPPSVTLALKVTEDDATTLHYAGAETAQAGSAGRTVDLNLKRDADRPWLDLAGTITLSQPGEPDEVIAIAYGQACGS